MIDLDLNRLDLLGRTLRFVLAAMQITPTYSEGPIAAALAQCDAELTALIHAIVEAPAEFLAIIFQDNDTQRITNRVSRMFRIRAGERDLVAELRALLTDGMTI